MYKKAIWCSRGITCARHQGADSWTCIQKIPAAATGLSPALVRGQIVQCVCAQWWLMVHRFVLVLAADDVWVSQQNVGHTALGFHYSAPNANASSKHLRNPQSPHLQWEVWCCISKNLCHFHNRDCKGLFQVLFLTIVQIKSLTQNGHLRCQYGAVLINKHRL